MASSEILPFALGAGANVLTPAQYAALTARLTGFSDGVADTPELNTVWRQSAFVAAALAQFVVDKTGSNVADDGNVTTLVANITAAIQTMVSAAVPGEAAVVHYGVDTGAANALTINVSPNITSYSSGTTIITIANNTNTGASTVNADSLGSKAIKRGDGSTLQQGDIQGGMISILVYDGTVFRLMGQIDTPVSLVHSGDDTSGTANAIVATVSPAISSYSKGMVFSVKIANTVTGASTVNLGSVGAVALKRADGSATQSGDLVAGQEALLVYDGTYFQIANFNPAPFVHSFGSSGYQRLPSGFILQWGQVAIPTTTPVTWTFPIAFPNSVVSAWAGKNGSLDVEHIVVTGWNTTNATFDNYPGSVVTNAFVFAIGY